MGFWENKRVLVTGGKGFLGRHVVERLDWLGAIVNTASGDLRERTTVSYNYWATVPEIVIHLAALSGGIQKNMQRPADMFYDNLQMGMNVIEVGKNFDTPVKIVMMGSACEYPKLAPTPITESSLWTGYPEGTNGAYGVAKRALEAMGRAYRQQYDMNIIHLLSANLYGPGDNFGDGSHIIPATIRRCVEARETKKDSLTLWGTGKATRDFLYVDDAVEGILLAAEHYNEAAPVNLGSGREISIYETAEKINILTGFNGELLWDGKMPDGQPRRVLATNLAKEKFGFEAQTLFECGLRETIAWYRASRLGR